MTEQDLSTLKFKDVAINPIVRDDQVWVRSTELAKALGYKQDRSITHIYSRYSDEFTPEMSRVLNLGTRQRTIPTRIFSPRGCHMVAMFSKTKVAKEFRKWVLDVLDKYTTTSRWEAYGERCDSIRDKVPQGYFSIFHASADMARILTLNGVEPDWNTIPDI